jgi:hypothetical protein
MMGRPFRVYSMSLVERLGFKTLDNMYNEMDSTDIMEWMAYDMIKNPEVRERLEKEISIEYQKTFTAEQEADAMRAMLMGLGGNN